MTIKLSDILKIRDPSEYKVHFARWNKFEQPLDTFVRCQAYYQAWHEWRPKYNAFNRRFIFSVADFYHEQDIWLFCGIWEVINRLPDKYEVRLTDQGIHFYGRLKLSSPYRGRATRVKLEGRLEEFEVSEILREKYAGREFPGLASLNIAFSELEVLVHNEDPEWRGALENTKGIYLVADKKTHKLYIGAAYGEGGVWSRWRDYIASGHSGNIELKRLIGGDFPNYCRRNFRFSLLEGQPATVDDELILRREAYWKGVLDSRGIYGLNRN